MTAQEVTEATRRIATTTCTMGLASSTIVQTDKSLGIPPLREKILGDGSRFKRGRIEAGNTHSGINQLLIATHNGLLKMYCGTGEPLKRGSDENFIMQDRRAHKIHLYIDHGELHLPLGAQALLIHRHRSQPVGPAALHEF
jgi:hypothetical protein